MEPRRAELLLNGFPLPALAVDHRSRVLAVNPAAEAMFGPDLTDRPFVTVIRTPQINHAIEWVLSNEGEAPVFQASGLHPPEGGVALRVTISARGRDRACDASIAPIPIRGRPGALVVLQDTSGIEQAEQMRRDFVANVSHELRTPLTALMGFIETLRGAARNDAAARDRFLAIMESEAGRMSRMISDLLSLTRVESNERIRPSKPVDLAALLRAAAATLTPAATAAGVVIRLEGVDQPVVLAGDSDQLTQVFHNLIENAMKYGGSGGEVGLSMTYLPHDPQLRGPAWAVVVTDKGEGIDALHLPRLTERFYRVDDHRSREKGGTGLGLAIVKHIVNRHRGRLRIESEKGKGSRFSVILPERHQRG
ncbi:MAG: ATP-binding protein [Paracoccus sp. (in: a-proteobacteria)]|uniref:ATP-binding protein n=1 Tax=Paracoccus sp. TaxID=267 RepID=UPI0026DF5C7F|nr:ATP-binding protein [Paracoccus sp. (in: a-proteobacteria)]MDO5621032.1 ATP-binding protein [Paracoccus sp. (in: a-proteobacteria)]